jgi:hypothetical protein
MEYKKNDLIRFYYIEINFEVLIVSFLFISKSFEMNGVFPIAYSRMMQSENRPQEIGRTVPSAQ